MPDSLLVVCVYLMLSERSTVLNLDRPLCVCACVLIHKLVYVYRFHSAFCQTQSTVLSVFVCSHCTLPIWVLCSLVWFVVVVVLCFHSFVRSLIRLKYIEI